MSTDKDGTSLDSSHAGTDDDELHIYYFFYIIFTGYRFTYKRLSSLRTTNMRRIATFRLTTDRKYDGITIILYYNIKMSFHYNCLL
jgi:hypothetical protein